MNVLFRPRLLLTFALTIFAMMGAKAEMSWQQMEKEARGQTVYFNAWGGSEAINAYIEWAAKAVRDRYGVILNHVKITDAAEIVQRIRAEKDAQRDQDGSVDLLWVNGENFHVLKSNQALHGPWVKQLPNWQWVDKSKPVTIDFSVPTDGFEAPWGMAQLTFIADSQTLPQPPRSIHEFAALVKKHPGKFTYPKPPAFHGTTFLKQILLTLSNNDQALQKPVNTVDFERVSKPLWSFLDDIHPHFWREGKAFANGIVDMHRQLADGELLMSMTFNPNEAANLVASEQLPESSYSFGFSRGTIANVHFLAIPYNAQAKEGAKVVANFLLSPEAQTRKANTEIWGDPTVLLPEKLGPKLNQPVAGKLIEGVPSLDEPHASWVQALENGWIMRYGVQ